MEHCWFLGMSSTCSSLFYYQKSHLRHLYQSSWVRLICGHFSFKIFPSAFGIGNSILVRYGRLFTFLWQSFSNGQVHNSHLEKLIKQSPRCSFHMIVIECLIYKSSFEHLSCSWVECFRDYSFWKKMSYALSNCK